MVRVCVAADLRGKQRVVPQDKGDKTARAAGLDARADPHPAHRSRERDPPGPPGYVSDLARRVGGGVMQGYPVAVPPQEPRQGADLPPRRGHLALLGDQASPRRQHGHELGPRVRCRRVEGHARQRASRHLVARLRGAGQHQAALLVDAWQFGEIAVEALQAP
jgi:hypothetical protein